MSHPFDSVVQTGVQVDKQVLRSYVEGQMLSLANAADIRNFAFASTTIVWADDKRTHYYYDSADTTSADDGDTVILDATTPTPRRYKKIAPAGDVIGPAAAVSGAVAVFSGTSGKTLADLAGDGVVKVAAGVASAGTIANADMADMAAGTFKGRRSTTGTPENISQALVIEEATPSAGHYLLGWVGATFRKFDVANLPGGTSTPPPTRQVFKASGTWTRPAGCKKIRVALSSGGAGGAGGGPASGDYAGGGGGGGGAAESVMDATTLTSETVTVGAGGTAGANASAGGNGGDSSFGSLVTSTGGLGGAPGTALAPGDGGAGGAGTGDIVYPGAAGQAGSGPAGSATHGGAGGNGGGSLRGPGGGGGLPSSGHGKAGGGYGGGGGGGGSVYSVFTTGGPGPPGIVIVDEYY